jgi:hypothetical protein
MSDETTPDPGSESGTGSESEPAAPPAVIGETEQWKEKATRLRVIFYVAGTHVLAGIMWLFFYIGSHAHK